jgi:hypothetical protein
MKLLKLLNNGGNLGGNEDGVVLKVRPVPRLPLNPNETTA